MPANFEHEAWKVRPAADDGERRRRRRRNRFLFYRQAWRRAQGRLAGLDQVGKETVKNGTPQSFDIARLGAEVLGRQRGDQTRIGAIVARRAAELRGQ